MGRRGGDKSGTPQRRPSTLSPAIIHRRIDACKINHLSTDDIAEHLYSSYPDYKHYKLIPFRTKIKQILRHSRRPTVPPSNNVVGEDEMVDEEAEDEQKSMEHRRKKQKKMIDDREEKLLKIEDDHVRRRRYGCTGPTSSSSDSEESVSTSEDAIYGVDVNPEFDLMKSLLREGYGGPKSDSKAKSKVEANEDMNMEVEDVRKEKAVTHSLTRRGDGGGKNNSSEVVQERASVKGAVEGKGKELTRFKDLGGMKNVLEELKMEVLVPLYHPQLLQWLGVKPVAGILLHGPPGCGKTKLAHAIANETGVPFYQISATEVVSGVSGASEENIRELFSKAYRTAPSIVFIDEIDAIASKRENLQREMERRIVTQLLTCMDESHRLLHPHDKNSDSESADKKSGYVLVIGATNRPDAVDPALRRPGRFDREIALGVPDDNARVEILSILTQSLRLAGDFDLVKIARMTSGFVGADLAALANKAGNLAMKRIMDQRRLELYNEDGERDEEWWKEPWSPEGMEKLSITMSDFEASAKMVQPSLRREGFSAIPNVKWEDVGGLNELREVFERFVVRRIKYPEHYENIGVDMDTGFLLYGPPGCGKTLIAKAVANEAGANFIHVKGPELLNKYVGESELHVRTIFTRARTCTPCVLFFDEVDALTTKRGKEGSWVVERLLTQLLIELDGADRRRGVFVIGATNRPEVIDDALKRPGRLGRLLYVPLPGPDERGLILKALARKKRIDESVDLLSLGRDARCENLSGADLAALMDEAAMAALDEELDALREKPCLTGSTIKYTHIELGLRKTTPSVSPKQVDRYERLSKELSSNIK